MQIPPFDDEDYRAGGGAGRISSPQTEIDLSPPASLSRPLWRSLSDSLRDLISPERLPPLHLSSQPVDVGMLPGDVLDLPWYRTVFTNLGDVITPETLPPLQLESRAVDVGELVSDLTSHPWWASLLRNLADTVSPEPILTADISSSPVNPESASSYLQVPRWSSLISTPKVFLRDTPEPIYRSPLPVFAGFAPGVPTSEEAVEIDEMVQQLKKELRHSRLREKLWIATSVVTLVLTVISLVH